MDTDLNAPVRYVSSPVAAALSGSIVVPGDKSISHRCALFGLISQGEIRVRGYLPAEDTLATLRAVESLGATVEGDPNDQLVIHTTAIRPADGPLDMGNSGTGMRLLAGILAGQPFSSELCGDVSLTSRPMGRIVRPLSAMGADIKTGPEQRPPLRFGGAAGLKGISWTSEVSSAQVKSCVLLAGLFAEGETRISEPSKSRDHTERLLSYLGAPVVTEPSGAIVVNGGSKIRGGDVVVPGDPSSAAFHLVAGSLVPESDVLLRGVGMNPLRIGFIKVLKRMGANIEIIPQSTDTAEPIADIRVRHSPLHGIDVGPEEVPDMIDEFPVFFVAAACATGTTRVTGAEELRVKESDRIDVMAKALRSLGVDVTDTRDSVTVSGGALSSGQVHAQGDHRCAMALLVAGAVAEGSVVVSGCEGIPTSYPSFPKHASELGMLVESQTV